MTTPAPRVLLTGATGFSGEIGFSIASNFKTGASRILLIQDWQVVKRGVLALEAILPKVRTQVWLGRLEPKQTIAHESFYVGPTMTTVSNRHVAFGPYFGLSFPPVVGSFSLFRSTGSLKVFGIRARCSTLLGD